VKDLLKNPRNASPYAILASLLVAVFLAFPQLEPYEDTVTGIVLTVAPVVVIWLEYRKLRSERLARLDDTFEANLLKLIEVVEYIRMITGDLAIFNAMPQRHREWIEQIEDRVVNLATKVQGFRDYEEMKQAILQEERRKGNGPDAA